MNNVASIKDRLRNQAKKSGLPLQELYTIFGLERTLYRLSLSKYSGKFVLKGGILLYAIFGSDFPRVTRDIDLLAQHISNETSNIKEVFIQILSIDTGDFLKYDLGNIKVIPITEFKEYHGVNVSTVAYLDKTRIPISIDIGFGDVVIPEKSKMVYPTILNMDSPVLYAYSKESVIAEKFEAIVQLGYSNGRLKDFYDIQLLASNFDFHSSELKEAIEETFHHRKTRIDDSFLYDNNFINNPLFSNRWEAFKKQKQATDSFSFSETVQSLSFFLSPIVKSIREKSAFHKQWNHLTKKWEDK
ncbi:MAG: nucleotidyl transferase AbiEii/AbiGii toxin family protein [Erysipelotrichaceae bacterium]|nr:nucleotidyl transferase AbiEii/AbiGii toxin family protein [Erysipelotrichaceae bacterium]